MRQHNSEILDDVIKTPADLMATLADGMKIGVLTTKGFGEIAVEEISAVFYDFHKKADVKAWLSQKTPKSEKASNKILPTKNKNFDRTQDFIVDADFAFNSSFIIRNYATDKKIGDNKISAVSLRSHDDFVIPGTSLKGILRHRAEFILRKIGVDDKFFIILWELRNPLKLKAALSFRRVMLFTTEPVWQKNSNDAVLHIHFEIRDANKSEAGLALFLLRDLCLGRIAVGGEKSVGRGTLRGISAKIAYGGKNYELNSDGKVTQGNASELSNLAQSVKNFSAAGENV